MVNQTTLNINIMIKNKKTATAVLIVVDVVSSNTMSLIELQAVYNRCFQSRVPLSLPPQADNIRTTYIHTREDR
ncbi:uncharacterized protein PG998_005452 [Apiospora kogelbergensis]|uniref:uncharacterized protein n=1 Tax=Apiospora kogelbergensis TaxID=1337665 RepID=UPI00312EF182